MSFDSKNLFVTYGAYDTNPKWQKMISREMPLYQRENDIRTEFGRDYTRILHSTAYRRLKHKTQVFFSTQNDHICTRIEHVNHVESVSYTIANYLGLNTELTKAIAVGHDLGHAPFGHLGETIIKEILKSEGLSDFWHERNGLHFVDDVELLDDNQGCKRNLGLTYAVRDGIISHCGEVDQNGLKPRDEYINLNEYKTVNQFPPYTWEGCIIKVADKISYLGRDIEDAFLLGILTYSETRELMGIIKSLPSFSDFSIRELNNTVLIHKLILDLCKNSTPEKGICMSSEYFEFMKTIKKFNYDNIYKHERLNAYRDYAKLIISKLYEALKSTYNEHNTLNNIMKLQRYYPTITKSFSEWIKNYWDLTERDKNDCILNNKVIYHVSENKSDYILAICDFISGMTDHYVIKLFNDIISF